MGKLVYGMMQSLDGYVAGVAGGPQLPRPGDSSTAISTIPYVEWAAASTGGACTM